MRPRVRWLVLLVVFGVAIWVAGQRGESLPGALLPGALLPGALLPGASLPGEPLPGGAQRLGPEAGELVAGYLRRASASLPAGHGGPVWALVAFDGYLQPESAAELTQGVRISRVILRVPLPRVQTALITRDLPGQRPVGELVAARRSAAQDRLAGSQAVPGGRPAAIAAAEAAQLRGGCACVLALLVLGDRDALRAVAARSGVRAVHAALPDTSIQDVAVSPLLPEQADLVGPVPDDGPVPP